VTVPVGHPEWWREGDDGRVAADPTMLRQALENLFRNAVDHVGTDVTVCVGPREDGFYVADDGPGIPADERDQVLELGYSTDPEGTGFGLGIVGQVADAHDWTLAVTESASGGSRFEFTGVRE
jgi:signal transduction histidine kinase